MRIRKAQKLTDPHLDAGSATLVAPVLMVRYKGECHVSSTNLKGTVA